MNDASKNKKDSVLKSLAIAGFIGIIILIAWLSVKFVNVAPEAFSSLASLAEGLNQQQDSALENEEVPSLTVTSNITVVNAGESVNLAWDTVESPGSYTFSYDCTDGVAIDIVEGDNLKSIACDTNYNIGNNSSLSLNVDSEKERFADVKYTISFLGTNDTKPRFSGSSSLTVMNDQIHNVLVSNDTPETEVTDEEVVMIEESEVEEEIVDSETETVDTVTETATTPVYEQEFTYTIPVSDPNGRTDLSTKFISTGTIVGNTFFTGDIMQDEKGAIQFEVKNYGSKTSDNWEFEVSLPNGGTYSSDEQKPLKPNERAVLTIGFITNDDSQHTFVVNVDESTDRNSTNDSFKKTVNFLK